MSNPTYQRESARDFLRRLLKDQGYHKMRRLEKGRPDVFEEFLEWYTPLRQQDACQTTIYKMTEDSFLARTHLLSEPGIYYYHQIVLNEDERLDEEGLDTYLALRELVQGTAYD